MDRMRITALKKLITAAEGGGYTLPAEVLDAWRVYEQASALRFTDPAAPGVQDVAARAVAALAAGEEVDALELGRELARADADRAAAEKAKLMLSMAAEQAADRAVARAGANSAAIVTEHLRPAFTDVLGRARDVGDALTGYGLDPHKLITAPAKVRNAYAELPGLVARHRVILDARRWAEVGRQPERDTQGLYASLRHPEVLFPSGQPVAGRLPWPKDPTEALLWLAAGEGAKAEPWLPTIAERDAAWWEANGEQVRKSQGDRMLAQAAAGGALVVNGGGE